MLYVHSCFRRIQAGAHIFIGSLLTRSTNIIHYERALPGECGTQPTVTV